MADRLSSTRYADEVSDDYGNESNNTTIAIVGAAIFFIATPLTVFAAALTYLAFAWQKVKLSTIFWFLLAPYVLIVLIFIKPAIAAFTRSWEETIPAMVEQRVSFLDGFLELTVQQAPLAVPFGIVIGLIYSYYRLRTSPKWIETKFKASPYELWRKRKNIKDIKSDKNSPKDGMTLGIDADGVKIVQSYAEGSTHTVALGATGSGKTTTLMSRLRDAIKSGQGAIIIDLKGDPKLAVQVANIAARYDKKITHWLLQPRDVPYTGPAPDGPAYYDPLARGEATRRKDLLIESRTWTEEYYKQEASNYIQMLFAVLVANPKKDVSTLSDVVHLLDPRALQERAIPLGNNPLYHDVVRSIDSLNDEKLSAGKRSAIDGLRSQLEVLLHSIAGPYLQLDPKGTNTIDLKRAAHKGEIIVFSLDANNYGGLAALVANLIIQDLKTVASELRNDLAEQPVQIIIDEFSMVGSDNIIGLVNTCRDANMEVTLATQTLGDLRLQGTAFLDQLVGIVGSFIIHRPNTIDDATFLAGLTGTVLKKRFNESVEYKTGLMSKGSASGSGSIQDVEEFTITPDKIQRLKQGEMIYVSKTSSPMKVIQVLCIPEDPSMIAPHESKLQDSVEKAKIAQQNSALTAPDTKNYPAPPLNIQAIQNASVVPIIAPSNEKGNPIDEEPSIEVREPNMDRLSQIFNQAPEQFLSPKATQSRDDFTVTNMPPHVSTPLPASPDLKKTKFPPLPVLPQKPPVRTLPSIPKDINVKNTKPNEPISKKTQKDEFDF
jgi:hypothetical protein